MSYGISSLKKVLLTTVALFAIPTAAFAFSFTPGDIVIDTVSGSTLDAASPLTLTQFSLGSGGTSATQGSSLTLPQTANGANAPISGEYGSASEGFLTNSVNGQYLTLLGYGVNATSFNTAPASTYGTSALGQTTSLPKNQQTGTLYTTVARVVGLIGSNGGVNTTTALTGVFNENNPRSVATVNGTSFYVSGQGAGGTPLPGQGPTTKGAGQGVYLATLGSTTATAIDTSTDTRFVSIVNNGNGNTLYVSRDFNPPSGGTQNFTNVSSLTNPSGGLPTSSSGLITTHVIPPASPLSSGGNNGSINLTAALANGINNARIGSFVYLSPEQYFFANPDTLYVADSGQPKNGNVDKAALGEGGLQKWTFNSSTSTWTLDYDLVSGLNLVNNDKANANTPTAPGVTGLFGLTGKVVGNEVELFATSYGLNELSSSFLYEITDSLSNTSSTVAQGETFNTLFSAPADESIRGVALAPTPLPSGLPLFATGIGLLVLFGWGRRHQSVRV